jgi:hypothetical protein
MQMPIIAIDVFMVGFIAFRPGRRQARRAGEPNASGRQPRRRCGDIGSLPGVVIQRKVAGLSGDLQASDIHKVLLNMSGRAGGELPAKRSAVTIWSNSNTT